MATFLIPGPKERASRALGYLCVGLAGVWVWASPPFTLTNTLGWLTIFWCGFLAAALPAAAAAAWGRFRWEYACLPFVYGALLVLALTQWYHVYTDSPEITARAFIYTGLSFCYLVRFFTLRRLVNMKGLPARWTMKQ